MNKKIIISVIVLLIVGVVLYLIFNDKQKIYTIKSELVDEYSTDLKIIVLLNDKEFLDYKYLKDDNNTILCYSKNPTVNKYEIEGLKNIIIVLNDESEIIAEVIKWKN